jgi:hypothetical protein
MAEVSTKPPGFDEASIAFLHNWEPSKRHDRPLTEGGQKFELTSNFKPAGDQPEAIAELIEGLEGGARDQVLLGVTGSGKTFTIAHVIQKVQRPTIVLAPNKTLAAQLYGEMKEFFPNNAVEYFVSYYDYYQPEAYVPRTPRRGPCWSAMTSSSSPAFPAYTVLALSRLIRKWS